ncbi:MAG: hypothetical protein UR27_C0001G0068 [Candidatus Peregrinibacteria bacterium GW2011_GWA2_33_10]|nr:MAG: hypothetical protein UR27_C0001G0068 [Candidatus Peregrinibacteria bacterium GW2011_GWA2_33_10]KKP39797.1 MAG: hypothetical protein UR30_C0008G0066 [Candidatus Peregrinibacteria bacterium GW2011_GWC2_33_13]
MPTRSQINNVLEILKFFNDPEIVRKWENILPQLSDDKFARSKKVILEEKERLAKCLLVEDKKFLNKLNVFNRKEINPIFKNSEKLEKNDESRKMRNLINKLDEI